MRLRVSGGRRRLAAAAVGLTLPFLAQAAALRACDRPVAPTVDEKDVLLRFGALVKQQLDASGSPVALIARSGLDLKRIDVRYSHAGVALKDNGDLPWSIRELYFACDEQKPRLYDEGMAGFLMGTDDPSSGWISVVLLPPGPSGQLQRAALDKRQALRVLGATYSANAYPFNTRYQNCNQWVMELLASAFGQLEPPTADQEDPLASRELAQRWLYDQRYAPTVFEVSAHPMMWIDWVVPWLHNDDHPPSELARNRYSVSMPSSIETFVHAKVPGAERIEMCHANRRVVIHRGWTDIAEGCEPGPDDQVLTLARD